MTKVLCDDMRCGWCGDNEQLLTAPNPFDPLGGGLCACPECKQLVGTILSACEIDGCWSQATCGTPTAGGYKRTCGLHAPRKQDNDNAVSPQRRQA
jgi:hypothetical protein